CTAQALLAVMAGFYAGWHGAEGLTKIARRIHRQTCILGRGIVEAGFELESEHFFDTLPVRVDEPARQALLHHAQQAGINLRADRDGFIGISINEQTRRHHLSTLLGIFRGSEVDDIATLDTSLDADFQAIPDALRRKTAYLEHEVFARYRSETEMLRYLKRLENRDL